MYIFTRLGGSMFGSFKALTLARLGTVMSSCLRINHTNVRFFSPCLHIYKLEHSKKYTSPLDGENSLRQRVMQTALMEMGCSYHHFLSQDPQNGPPG